MSRVFSSCFGHRKGLCDVLIQLGIDRLERLSQAGGRDWCGSIHRSQCRAKHPCLQAGVQPRQLPPARSQVVALAFERPTQQPLAHQPSQVVGGLSCAILLERNSQQSGHLLTQVVVADSLDGAGKLAQDQHQCHDPWVAKLQSRRSLTVLSDGRLHHPLDAVGAQTTVLTDTLDFQQAAVDLAAKEHELGHLLQALVESKVGGIVKSPLGAQSAAFFEVLFEIKMLVADVQARMDALTQYARAETARRGADNLAWENQLHPVWSAQVEVVADDFLEELPTGQGPIHNLGEAKLHLPNRQPVAVAG